MKRKYLRGLSLVLVIAMLLSGCAGSIADAILAEKDAWEPPKGETQTQPQEETLEQPQEQPQKGTQESAFDQMEYGRPDMQAFEDVLLESCRIVREETDREKVIDAVYDFYDVYDRFYTDLALADIYYSCDLTDTYWQEEYAFCVEQLSVADAGLEELYYSLAESPIRAELEEYYFGEGFFDGYDGESVYSDALLSLLEQEAQLQSRYQQMTAEKIEQEDFLDQNVVPLTQLLIDLVLLRQQIAREAGYDSYADFAYEFYHYRDYTAREAREYIEEIPTVMGDLYWEVNESGVWQLAYEHCPEEDTFAHVQTAANNMGGRIARGFNKLEKEELYHITYGDNKAVGAFETYLWSYGSPYVFLSPYLDQTDKLSFAHEFGHFLNDYVCSGSNVGTDIAEIHSQGFEYLSLFYADDTEILETYKLADSLFTYVEQAAYSLFELRLYEMSEDELTVENVMALYAQIGRDFGFESWNWDSRNFVQISHFYTDPMYIISYVVSNDVAFQIYQLEKETAGAGLEVYESCLKSQDTYLLAFAQEYGLESPFAPGRLEEVRATLEAGLADYL